MTLSQEKAEEIALRCLAWLARNDELLPVFLGSTGASAEDLKAGAEDPVFLGSVLDFLLMDDAWVRAFCEAEGIRPETPMTARMALPGGAQVHWT
ncbi:MAG: DUF3572 domain-containing protein [Roseovarius sp.]